MGNANVSITYRISVRDPPLSEVRIRPAAGDPRRGWLTAGGWSVPVALGRGGIRANKREGDGGTPRGTFHPVRLWWRADRHQRPRTLLLTRPIRLQDALVRGPPATAITISRSGSTPARPATGWRAKTLSMILSSRSTTTARPGSPTRQRGISTPCSRQFRSHRRLRIHDQVLDAAAAAADEPTDQNHHRLAGPPDARHHTDHRRVTVIAFSSCPAQAGHPVRRGRSD